MASNVQSLLDRFRVRPASAPKVPEVSVEDSSSDVSNRPPLWKDGLKTFPKYPATHPSTVSKLTQEEKDALIDLYQSKGILSLSKDGKMWTYKHTLLLLPHDLWAKDDAKWYLPDSVYNIGDFGGSKTFVRTTQHDVTVHTLEECVINAQFAPDDERFFVDENGELKKKGEYKDAANGLQFFIKRTEGQNGSLPGYGRRNDKKLTPEQIHICQSKHQGAFYVLDYNFPEKGLQVLSLDKKTLLESSTFLELRESQLIPNWEASLSKGIPCVTFIVKHPIPYSETSTSRTFGVSLSVMPTGDIDIEAVLETSIEEPLHTKRVFLTFQEQLFHLGNTKLKKTGETLRERYKEFFDLHEEKVTPEGSEEVPPEYNEDEADKASLEKAKAEAKKLREARAPVGEEGDFGDDLPF